MDVAQLRVNHVISVSPFSCDFLLCDSLFPALHRFAITCLLFDKLFPRSAHSRCSTNYLHTLPQLVFNYFDLPLGRGKSETEYDNRLVKMVDRVLLLHRGPIRKFNLSILLSSDMDIDGWILYLSRNGIREFILNKCSGEIYKAPSSMFLCEDITYLELYRCSLIPPTSFNGFSNLRNLNLESVSFSNNGIDKLISNSPLLNKLRLAYISGCTRIKLCAPNLVDLVLIGTFEDLCFEKTPVLAKTSIELLKSDDGEYSSLANGATSKLINLLSCLPSMRRLELLEQTYQILSAGDVPVKLPTTCQLSHLTIRINFEDTQHMLATLCIFRSSLFLQKVDIYSISDETREEISVLEFWKAHKDFDCLFNQLQIINVSEYRGTTAELKFIEFVLANAPVLETVKIVLKEKDNTAEALRIIRKLTQFRRNSSKAELVVPE